MSALQDQFVAEARELIRQATDNLIALERDGMSPERIDSVFRAFHTLKGSAGVVELPAMSIVLHAAEDLLDSVRHGRLEPAPRSSMPRWPASIRCRVGSTTSRLPERCPPGPAKTAARWRSDCDRFCRVEVASSQRPPYQIFRRKGVKGHCPNGSHS